MQRPNQQQAKTQQCYVPHTKDKYTFPTANRATRTSPIRNYLTRFGNFLLLHRHIDHEGK